MMGIDDADFMEMALEEATAAFAEGEVPVGSVLVIGNTVIARAHNTKEYSNDPTNHAEMLALKSGAQKVGRWRLSDATLYVTMEPCIMCAGAMVNARLGRLVYGCRDDKGGAVDSLYALLSDQRLNHRVAVVSGVLEEECAEMLKKFFRDKRQLHANRI
jgi:tRNA(adenine34) deaminase